MSETARERIVDAIERFQRNYDRMVDINTGKEDRDKSIVNIIHFFNYTVLLELLRQHDAPFADRVGQWLHETVEDGGGVGEWMWEWQQDIAAGRPLALPDFHAGEPL